MRIKIIATGEEMPWSKFQKMYPRTSFPVPITNTTLARFGAVIVPASNRVIYNNGGA